MQKIIHLADEKDKQPGELHHYRNIDKQTELSLITLLDQKIEQNLSELAIR